MHGHGNARVLFIALPVIEHGADDRSLRLRYDAECVAGNVGFETISPGSTLTPNVSGAIGPHRPFAARVRCSAAQAVCSYPITTQNAGAVQLCCALFHRLGQESLVRRLQRWLVNHRDGSLLSLQYPS
jgi:hypothetical protein